jgi:high-affinity iron transporter
LTHGRPTGRVAVVALVLALVATGGAVPTAAATTNVGPTPVPITMSAGHCASSWASRHAGQSVFTVTNRSGHTGSIFLFNPHTGVTVAQKAALGPGATAVLSVRLKPGTYQWSCVLDGLPKQSSTVVQVSQAPRSSAAGPIVVVPVSAAQMAGAIATYRAYVTAQLALLTAQVELLQSAIAGGQLSQSEGAWLTAHLTWHRIGAAYDAFGTLGTMIDGTAAGLQGGTASPDFGGFHKVELDLWQQGDLAVASGDAAHLLSSVDALSVQFSGDTITATELPLRTHEILEDASRDELTGTDDYGSGTDMASVEADVDGTRELLTILAPLLAFRAPDLESTATAQLDRLDAALDDTQVNGQWVAATLVPLAQRQQVNGAMGEVLEVLALMPELLQVQGSTS